MRVGIVAGRVAEGHADLANGLRAEGLDAWVLTPDAAVATLGPGDAAIVHLDIVPSLDGFEAGLDHVPTLRRAGVRVLNTPWAVLGAHDKQETARRLAALGLPHPRTVHVRLPGQPIRLPPPVVVKPRFGSWGTDVFRCSTSAELHDLLRALETRRWFRRQGALVQELLPPPDHDLRLVVAAGTVAGAARRAPAAGEWRTNVSLGGSLVGTDPSPEAEELALAAVEAVGGDLVGVDLLPLPDGGYSILELNIAAEFDASYSLRGGSVYAAVAEALALWPDGSREHEREVAGVT